MRSIKDEKNENVQFVMQALEEIFEETNEPVQAIKIRERVATLKSEKYSCVYDKDSVQSTVSRTLDYLDKEDFVICIDERGRHRVYLPNNINGNRKRYGDSLLSEVEFVRPSICVLDGAIMICVSDKTMDEAKRLFRLYLGEEDCFDVVEFKGYLTLLLSTEDKAAREALVQEIKKITLDGYEKYSKTQGEQPMRLVPKRRRARRSPNEIKKETEEQSNN